LNKAATRVRTLLRGTSGTDDDIENAIGDLGAACDSARKAPA
jgi:hypothetical protein